MFWLLLFILILGYPSTTFAESKYLFSCEESTIQGAIKYSVIGKYVPDFKKCTGIMIYDDQAKQVKSVHLEIQTQSIHSNCEWCDKIVISKQLLDAEKYPRITFNSDHFKKDAQGYWVNGNIDLHGQTKDLNSRFNAVEGADGNLSFKGKWVLRRKDFNIVWNRVLDHGGILVGDYITVDWKILAKRVRET